MTRSRTTRLALAAGAAVALGLSAAAGPLAGSGTAKIATDGGAARAPARLLVYAQEWSLWPSRQSLPAGRLIVQLWNRGQDAHDLRVRLLRHGVMVGRTQAAAVTQSGRLSQATWSLRPGTYQLYCSMPGHMKRGMRARITIR
jgi:plastocyanin